MPPPLAGLRVLDASLGPVAGMTTMVLADFGESQIVEPCFAGNRGIRRSTQPYNADLAVAHICQAGISDYSSFVNRIKDDILIGETSRRILQRRDLIEVNAHGIGGCAAAGSIESRRIFE